MLIELLLRITGACYSFLHTHNFFNHDSGKIKILCLGESTTFGLGANKGKDYPSQLNNLLEMKYPNKFLVYNRGVPGTTSGRILLHIEKIIWETRPDLVILLCGANEYNLRLNSVASAKDKNYLFSNMLSKIHSLLSDLRTYKLIVTIVDHLKYERFRSRDHIFRHGRLRDFNEQEKSLLKEQYLINVRKITQMIRSEKSKIVYSTYLWPWGLSYGEIIKAAYENQVVLCDQAEMLRERGISFSRVISKDGFHPNSLGYNLMAEFLLKTLEESSILLQLLDNEKNKHK